MIKRVHTLRASKAGLVRYCAAFTLFVAPHWCSADAPTFEGANQLYSEGKFEEAEKAYRELAEGGQSTPNVYYNLGNAEYRVGSKGRAILDYERALRLDPSHPEAQANLKLVREQSGSRPMAATWIQRMLLPANGDVYAILAAASEWILILLVAWLCLRRRTEALSAWFGVALAGMLGGYSGIALWQDWQDRSIGIITAPRTVARLANAASAGAVENLPEGSEVAILSERDGWVYCDLPGRERGWVPAAALEKVRKGGGS